MGGRGQWLGHGDIGLGVKLCRFDERVLGIEVGARMVYLRKKRLGL